MGEPFLDLSGVQLRSNPRFRLVSRDRLQPLQLRELGSLCQNRDFFGILVPPPDSGLPVKSLSHDAALLFLALAEPACLPHLLTHILGASPNERLRQLVLDQIFEVEHAGQFISGVAASALLDDTRYGSSKLRTAQLSLEAIEYATALRSLPALAIAGCLYGFNRAPGTRALQVRFASDDRLCSFLCPAAESVGQLKGKWSRHVADDTWLMWSSAGDGAAVYKLYVSPRMEALPEVFCAAVDAFAKVGCSRFKVGRGAYGVLRPDKFVAYFIHLDQVLRAAEMIGNEVGGAPAQGVPFSAGINASGLLSWGMDPPRFELTPAGSEHQSWRRWLSERIALYITMARQSDGDVPTFVRQRIALDGVDPVQWIPNLSIWRGPVGTEQEAS